MFPSELGGAAHKLVDPEAKLDNEGALEKLREAVRLADQVRVLLDPGGDLADERIVARLEAWGDGEKRTEAMAKALRYWSRVVPLAEASPAFAPTSVDMAGAGDGGPELDDVVAEVIRKALANLDYTHGRTVVAIPQRADGAPWDREIEVLSGITALLSSLDGEARSRCALWAYQRHGDGTV